MWRRCLSLSILALIILVTGCASSPNPLVGTWEMVSNDGRWLDTAEDPELTKDRNVKVINESHFAFGHQHPDGHIDAGGGRYVYADSTYTETIDYHFAPHLVGLTVDFDCRLEDDLWYHSADFEWSGGRFVVNEIWRRLER